MYIHINYNDILQAANTILSQLQRRNIANPSVGLYESILLAILDLQSRSDSECTIVLLSHGNNTHNLGIILNQSIIINLININGITVHTIAVPNVLGNIPVVNYDRLNNIAYYTGGTFNTIWNFHELFWEFARTDMTDTDGDGIIDFFEKAIADGRILLADGTPMPYTHLLSYLEYDSDGDGLSDG